MDRTGCQNIWHGVGLADNKSKLIHTLWGMFSLDRNPDLNDLIRDLFRLKSYADGYICHGKANVVSCCTLYWVVVD